MKWANTNKLLREEGFDGIKTGITDYAGPCLSSSYRKVDVNLNIHIIAVILNSKSVDIRWQDTKILCEWALKRFYDIKDANLNVNVNS